MGSQLLIADDQTSVLDALELVLEPEGWSCLRASSPQQARSIVREHRVDLALIDLNYTRDTTSGREGFALLEHLKQANPALPVIVMTAWSNVDIAVAAMKRGATDFIEKPWKNARLLGLLRAQLELGAAQAQASQLEHTKSSDAQQLQPAPTMVAADPAMQPTLEIVRRIGPSTANVLITGEHGTGKEVLARYLHQLSPRSEKPLVVVNAGGLADGVFESELFGHMRGAFTDAKADRTGCFELADGGTLFLDEIGNMPLHQQAKLLRVLQTGEIRPVGSSRTKIVDVRVISATNADIPAQVEQSAFREDLLYRLNTIEIPLPALRHRKSDILRLSEVFLQRSAQRYSRGGLRLGEQAQRAMTMYAWPGNIRQLEHAIERGVLMATGDTVTPDDLGITATEESKSAPEHELEALTLDEVERRFLTRALEQAHGNVSEAAASLGLSRQAFYRRLSRHERTSD